MDHHNSKKWLSTVTTSARKELIVMNSPPPLSSEKCFLFQKHQKSQPANSTELLPSTIYATNSLLRTHNVHCYLMSITIASKHNNAPLWHTIHTNIPNCLPSIILLILARVYPSISSVANKAGRYQLVSHVTRAD